MKRSLNFLPLFAFTALGCAVETKNPNIVAAGHVEATDVHISAKVGGRRRFVACS